MRSFLNISPEDLGKGGGGTSSDDDSQFPARTLRSHGFLALAFGFALGLTIIIFFGLFQVIDPPGFLKAFVTDPNNLWRGFLVGLIAGTLLAGIYNFLIFRRINLFGLDRNLD